MTKDKGIFIKNIYYMLAYAFRILRQKNYDEIAADGYTGAVKPPVRMTGNRESGHKETGMCAAEPPSRRRCSSGWAPVNGLLLLFA